MKATFCVNIYDFAIFYRLISLRILLSWQNNKNYIGFKCQINLFQRRQLIIKDLFIIHYEVLHCTGQLNTQELFICVFKINVFFIFMFIYFQILMWMGNVFNSKEKKFRCERHKIHYVWYEQLLVHHCRAKEM